MRASRSAAGSMGSANSLFVPDPESNWWPSNLGSPNALGSQNNVRYAYFANINRLAVKTGNEVWVYDTLNHQIGGFAQQQGGGSSITFTSQFGTISLSSLPVVTRNGVIQSQPMPLNDSSHQQHGETVIDTLERLGVLFEKGYITADEFATKKADLLSRL